MQKHPTAKGGLREEMRGLPPFDPETLPATEVAVSLLIPARGAGDALEATVHHAYEFMTRSFPSDFEIILIPNPPLHPKPGATPDRSTEVAEQLAGRFERVRVQAHFSPAGKGAALRSGFRAARGRWIFFTDADLPYQLDFFDQAAAALRGGFDFVTGNRRLATSVFDVPVSLLKLAYARHRLGLGFNRVARWMMPIYTTDTQAGIKAMSRRLAVAAFSRQRCPGFFFDLELFLTARGHRYRHVELPVTLYLNTEKSTVRVLRESILAGFWLTRIAARDRFKSAYSPAQGPEGSLSMLHPESFTLKPLARYRGTPLGTRVFLEARWRLTPYSVMAGKLPPKGRILDLGCGHGLFALALAMGSADRDVIGLDHDGDRIALATRASRGLANLRFTTATLSDPLGKASDLPTSHEDLAGISMIDVLHYFPRAEQERLFDQAFALLAPGGTLIVREVDPAEGLMSSFNRFYEKIATTTGFTRSEQKRELHFRLREEWEECLRRAGFEVASEPCSHPLFADILYICRKPAGGAHPA